MPRLLSLLLLLCLSLAARAGKPLVTYASVPPITAIVAAVGGKQVEAHSLLRPGDNPVTFSPTPRQLAQLARSRLFVAAGLPFERAWLPRIRASSPGMRVLDLATALHPPAIRGEDDHELDPHLWTDPLLVIRMSEAIREALSALDPDHSAQYRRRQAEFARRIAALHRELDARLAPLRGRGFLVFHPAWGYFARRYGLHQLAIQHEGKQGGARWMAQLIERARREGIKTVVVQPQFDQRLARQIADAIGGRVLSVDPLAGDYAASLRRLAAVIAGGSP